MEDSIFTAAVRLYEQECSLKEISRRLKICEQKVKKIIVTTGHIDTEEARLFREGYSLGQICQMLDEKKSCVCAKIPYGKGIYYSEHPTKNALAIRRHRQRKSKA